MSKIDRNKLLANAQKLIQRGDLPKAVQQYETLLAAQPKDVQSLLRLAGLYIRVDRVEDAVAAYSNAGKQYSATGFYQKAVAAYKQALQLTDKDPALLHELGNLYQQMGLRGPAVEHYSRAAHFFGATGNIAKALEVIATTLELEPDRPDLKARYGEMLFQAGRKEEAIAVFRGLVEILKLEGQWEDLARFYERILQINADDNDIGIDLARTYLRLGLAPKALQRLKTLFDSGVRDAEVFDLLARSYVLLGKNGKAVSAYLEKAKRLNPGTDSEEIEKTFRRILEIDPTNEDALAAIGEGEDESEVLQIFDDEPAQRETIVEVVALDEDEGPALEVGHEGTGGEFSEILQEASVYIRYGIKEKAIKKLDQILAKDANNLAALKKRIEVYADSDPARTIPDLVRLSEVYEGLGDLDAAERYIEEAKRIDAKHPALRAFLGLSADDQVLAGSSENVTDLAQTGTQEMYPDAGDFLSELGDAVEIESEADIDIEFELEGESEPELLKSQAQAVVAEPATQPYDDEVDQARFFLEAGLHEEAQKLLDTLVSQFGKQAVFTELLEKIPKAAPPAPTAKPKAEPQTAAPGANDGFGGIFDIAKELEDELGFEDVAEMSPGAEDVPTFEEIFDAFKKGVKEQLSDEDADAHYDLGIAYMEMGIMQEALNEFEIAQRKPAKAPDAYNMMAITLTRTEDFAGAVEKYRAGLALPNLDDAIMLNMNYEAALLLEQLGRYKEALLHLKNVIGKDKNYREVGDCLKRMREKIQTLKTGDASV